MNIPKYRKFDELHYEAMPKCKSRRSALSAATALINNKRAKYYRIVLYGKWYIPYVY